MSQWKKSFYSHKAFKPFLHHLNQSKLKRGSVLKLKESKKQPQVVGKETIKKVLNACKHLRDKLLICLLYETGCRIGQAPLKQWCGKHHAPRFLESQGKRFANPEWRPYILAKGKRKYMISQASWKSLFAVLGSFYQYLIDEEYTEINPVAQIRQKSQYIRKQQTKQVIRRLTELQWDYVIETAELMADENPQDERTLFIMSCLYGMYLRTSELTASERWLPQMNHFYQDQDENWWFKTVGKGNKERNISVSNAMLKALKRYRKSLKLPPLPSPREATPLITKNHGDGPITSTRHIRRIVQTCFNHAIERMQADQFTEEAEQLKTATVHWLRHTGISEDVKIRPREHVRDDAGHSSSAITDKYIDIELRQRHATARKKNIRNL